MVTVEIKLTNPDGVSESISRNFDNMEDATAFVKFVAGKCEEKGWGFAYDYEPYVNPIARDMFPKWFIRQWQDAHKISA